MMHKPIMTRITEAALTMIVALAVTGCLNQGSGLDAAKNSGSTSSSGGTTTGGSSGSTGGSTDTTSRQFTITSGEVTDTSSSGGNNSTPPVFTLNFNATNLQFTLNDFCLVQGSGGTTDPARSCKCRYIWNETNLSNAQTITRTIDTAPTQITSFQVKCPAPTVFNTEITDGTIIKISFVPDVAAGNSSGFSTNTLNFTKRPVGSTGDFRDSEGRAFRNVFHYVCFDKFRKALQIDHATAAGPTNEETNETPILPLANEFLLSSNDTNSFSAQSYYFDFYVRSNEIGAINSGNQGFTCPQVNIGGLPRFYPLDTTFAVALQSSRDFVVPVVTGNIVVPISGSPAQGNILGFAAKPNADGTCPSFTDSAGRIRRTFRLRKYKAIYPIRYAGDGDIVDQSQPVNIIYVMDRPVDRADQDPLKPITRLGPKPCPFAFQTAQFGPKCSTDASLAGWNIDGTQINGNPKCPIYPPVPEELKDSGALKDDGTLVIRPFRPFLPHYLEDTSFRACTFQSSTPIDPEIVLSHDSTVFTTNGPHNFYCAVHYPPIGSILPPPNGDPFNKSPGACDLAASGAAIKTDKTYACVRTFDPTNSTAATPSAGCCQICSGPDCTSQGGGTTAAGRNAVFSPPNDGGNPAQAIKQLPRSIPNQTGGQGCFDPFED